jgi:hypothetical protein
MAMRRKSEMRMAVAANPKEMASMDVPKSLSVDASPRASAAAATAAPGSDGVDAGSPGHGRDDLCPTPLMSVSTILALTASFICDQASRRSPCTPCNFHFVVQPLQGQQLNA